MLLRTNVCDTIHTAKLFKKRLITDAFFCEKAGKFRHDFFATTELLCYNKNRYVHL